MGRIIKVTILDSGNLQIVPQSAFSGENNAVQLDCYCSDALKDYTKYIDFESNGVKYRSPAFTDGAANFVFNVPNIISNYNTTFQFVFISGTTIIKTQIGNIYVQDSVNAADQITFESGDILDDFEQRITLVEGKVDDFLTNFDVTVGTTTTLEAGEDATVTKTGTDLNPVLNFGIPRGIQGIQGDPLLFGTAWTTELPVTPVTNVVYPFAGTNEALIGGITWYNGDSAQYNGSAWVRIPFQSLANYFTANQTDIYNVTVKVPLTAGSYYTIDTAVAAIPTGIKKLGLIITFQTAASVWVIYRYNYVSVSGWLTMSNWVIFPKIEDLTNLQTPLFKPSQTFGLTDIIKINALKNCIRAFTVNDDGTKQYAIVSLTISGGLQIYIADVTGKAADYVPVSADCPFYYTGSSSPTGITTFTLIDNTASTLPYVVAKITIDMDLFKALQPYVAGGICTASNARIYLNTDVEKLRRDVSTNAQSIVNLNGQVVAIDTSLLILLTKYYNFNGVSSKYLLSKSYVLATDGDYVELLVRPNGDYGATNFDKIGIIGKGTNLGIFGIHPTTGLYYRDDVNAGVTVGANNVTLGAWHTLKLAVEGTNYVMYQNGVAVKTTAKTADLTFSRLGGTAYFSWYSAIDLQYLKINTAVDGLVELTDLTTGTSDTDVIQSYEKKVDLSSIIYPELLYNFTLSTKTFIVYQHIGHGYYNGIQISHEYDMSELVYKDYWRIINSKLYSYDGTAMTETLVTVSNVLDADGNPASVTTSFLTTNGESEFVTHETGKSDHTGGIHGDEILIEVNFFADGKLLSISADIELTEATEFSYIEKSTLHETSSDGVNPISGHPVMAYHYKRTVINSEELKSNNRVVYNGVYSIDFHYAGIYCASRLLTKYAYDEKIIDLYDMDTEMGDIGGVGLVEYHANNALSTDISTRIIAGGKTPTLAITDNLQPLSYKKYYCSISGTTALNEEWWHEISVKIKSNLDL